MNDITVIISSLVLGGILFYYVCKSFYVGKLTKAMQKKRYTDVIAMSKKTMMQRFAGVYNCDLYRIRAYSYIDEDRFKEELDEVLLKGYLSDKQKDLLEMYFHYFLLRNDAQSAAKMLYGIQQLGEPSLSAYSEQAYAVLIEHKTDLIEVMDNEINSKQYSGFALGVLVYLIGMQYLFLNDKEEARKYFYNSLSCFHAKSMYTEIAKKRVDELSNALGMNSPKY